jgi:ABC-type bacteriocin/lantibiotic exporter with double-glycine peptidase domain
MKKINLFIKLLDKEFKSKYLILIFLYLVLAIVEVISTAIFLPLIQLMQNDSKYDDNYFIKVLSFLGIEIVNKSQLLVYLALFIFFTYLFKLYFSLFLSRLKNTTIFNFQKKIQNKLFSIFLESSYIKYLTFSSPTLIQNIFTESTQIRTTMDALVLTITEFFIVISLILMALLYNFKLTSIGLGFFIILYYFWSKLKKDNLSDIGYERKFNERLRLNIFQTTFLSFKELMIDSKFNYFNEKWKLINDKIYLLLIKFQVKQDSIKPYLEFISISVICLLLVVMIHFFKSTNLLVDLGFFAAISYKLLPSINKLAIAGQLIKFNSVSVDTLASDIINDINTDESSDPIVFNKQIVLENVSFNYPNSNNLILNHVNLVIEKGSFIGIVGPSGSGKSTLTDLILGTLSPNIGSVIIDNSNLNETNVHSWWKNIGYVSQRLNLIDDTIVNNIVLGDKIDEFKVASILSMVGLEQFVNSLENGMYTSLSQNGGNISGGQKQRLLIARVLYKKPKVLILDEATSSLDVETELAIMEELKLLTSDITIIFITHRLTTLHYCNSVYQITEGSLSQFIP